MSTGDNKTVVVAATVEKPKRLQALWAKKRVRLAALVLVIVLVAASFAGAAWYRRYQAQQREQRYHAVVDQLTSLNQQGKSKEVIPVAEKYLEGKPEQRYQARPKYFLALAYMGTNQLDKAKPMLDQLLRDPNLAAADKPAILSALILIGQSNKDLSIEPYVEQMLAYMDESSKKPENKQYQIYYSMEKQRYQQILDSIRKQKK